MKLQNKGFYCTYLDMLTIIHEGRINLLKMIDVKNTPEFLSKINDLIRDNRSSGNITDVKNYLEHIRDTYKVTK